MKKAKFEEKPMKSKSRYTILINRSKKIKRNQAQFKSKADYKYSSQFILLKLFLAIILAFIFKLLTKSKFVKKINFLISKYILKEEYKNIKVCLCVIGKNENLYVK